AVWPLIAGPEARPDEDAADLLGAALDLGIGYFAAPHTDHDGRAGGPPRGRGAPGRRRGWAPRRGHRGHHLRLRHHPQALGADLEGTLARLVPPIRRPGPGRLAPPAAPGADRPWA